MFKGGLSELSLDIVEFLRFFLFDGLIFSSFHDWDVSGAGGICNHDSGSLFDKGILMNDFQFYGSMVDLKLAGLVALHNFMQDDLSDTDNAHLFPWANA